MRQFLRCLRADIQKTKRTSFMWLHLLIPFIYAGVFLLYFYSKDPSPFDLYQSYMTLMAVALPFLISIMCGTAAQLEEQAGKFQVLLGATSVKLTPYVSKIALLLMMNAAAVFLAIAVYLAGLTFVLKVPDLPYALFLEGGAWLFAGCVTLYMIYFLISCAFGIGASVLLGGAGFLMTALMNTGLGDAIWKYNPWAWGIRLSGLAEIRYFGKIDAEYMPLFDREMNTGIYIMTFVIMAVFITSILWFIRWEGRKANE